MGLSVEQADALKWWERRLYLEGLEWERPWAPRVEVVRFEETPDDADMPAEGAPVGEGEPTADDLAALGFSVS